MKGFPHRQLCTCPTGNWGLNVVLGTAKKPRERVWAGTYWTTWGIIKKTDIKCSKYRNMGLTQVINLRSELCPKYMDKLNNSSHIVLGSIRCRGLGMVFPSLVLPLKRKPLSSPLWLNISIWHTCHISFWYIKILFILSSKIYISIYGFFSQSSPKKLCSLFENIFL